VARVTLFAGPSAHGLEADSLLQPGDRLLPPARRGDIQALVSSSGQPGVIVLCDGIFQEAPAVSHAEICAALDAGWPVWGVSSMGAIRAWELRHEGMQGHGYVHAQFSRFDDFTDDEVCLLHFPEPPWFPVSEPLVNLRYALECRGPALGIAPAAAQAAVDALRALWFGDRTLDRMRAVLVAVAGVDPPVAQALIDWLEPHRIKALDLASLMAERPWDQPAGP
jgi:hypothetical protein